MSLCTAWTQQAVEVQHHTFLTSVLHGTEWSTTRPSRFTHGRAPSWQSELEGAGWAPVPVWMIWRGDSLLSLSGIEPPLLIPKPKLYTNCPVCITVLCYAQCNIICDKYRINFVANSALPFIIPTVTIMLTDLIQLPHQVLTTTQTKIWLRL